MDILGRIEIWILTRELLENLCVLYTVVTLSARFFTNQFARGLHLEENNTDGIFFFSALAVFSMLFPISISGAEGIYFDLCLAIIILASIYIGVVDGIVVSALTVVFRIFLGGLEWIWWSSGVVVYVILANALFPLIRGRRTAILITAALVTIVHLSGLALIAYFNPAYQYVSPSSAPANFYGIAIALMIAIPLAVYLLDLSLKSLLALRDRYNELQHQANYDGLTGLLNRRRFKELFDEMVASPGRLSVSVLMIDIDFFKGYNDDYGHQTGDIVLLKIAEVMSGNIRHEDLAARYGGEEFVIVLPDTLLETAAQVAERIRISVAGIHCEGRAVTVSVGVYSVPIDPNCDTEALIAAADQLLYQAKHLGRNRVVAAQSGRKLSEPEV